MTAWSLHGAGMACGVAVAVAAGTVLGGAWWLVAAVAAGGAVAGRAGALVQAVATLALVAGAAAAGAPWLVPLLVAGVVATAESGAAAERRTETSPTGVRSTVGATLVAAAVSIAILWLGDAGPGPAVPLALLAAAGATAALTALRP